ncbi:MAG: sodium/pantothenate symporter [Dethiobacteria bacterium]|jgi:sodium/pantothenate symporter|nr:sodium/panthothenate symporter [Bacillota bacterium]
MAPIIIPLALYLVGLFLLTYYSSRYLNRAALKGTFIEEYFIGGRSLGGFVLAMTLVATYTSASSFVGGPGMAYAQGLGWVLLSITQLPTAYITLAVLGKKFAIISRKINALTLIDILRHRYKSDFVVIIGSLSIICFFVAIMTAQYIGGARLFQAVTGYSYTVGLAIFAIAILFYVTIGGFRAVALSDSLQGAIMLIGTVVILIITILRGGGVENLMRGMYAVNPDLLTPFGVDGFISQGWIMGFWVLVGIGVIGLPQVSIRAMSYKNSASMHRAMIIGTFTVGFLMLGMHLVGTFGRVLLPGIENPDLVMPRMTIEVLPPWAAGIFFAGPLAAIMSTVDSLLIMASATVVKDLYSNYINPRTNNQQLQFYSLGITAILGVAAFLFALNPPDFLVWLNLFAFGGLQATFFWPTILGLYWKRANAYGAVASMISGTVSFIIFDTLSMRPLGSHHIVATLLIALAAFIIVSLSTPPPDHKIIHKFWGI